MGGSRGGWGAHTGARMGSRGLARGLRAFARLQRVFAGGLSRKGLAQASRTRAGSSHRGRDGTPCQPRGSCMSTGSTQRLRGAVPGVRGVSCTRVSGLARGRGASREGLARVSQGRGLHLLRDGDGTAALPWLHRGGAAALHLPPPWYGAKPGDFGQIWGIWGKLGWLGEIWGKFWGIWDILRFFGGPIWGK